jgi:hypothetical protein
MRSFEVTGTSWRSLTQRWGPWEWKITEKFLDWPFPASVGPITAKSHSGCTSCRCAQVPQSRCDRLRSLARSDHGQIAQRLHVLKVCAGRPVQMRSFDVTGTSWRSLTQRWGPWEWKISEKILDWPFSASVGPITAISHGGCTSCRCAQVAQSRCDRLTSLARRGGR